MDEEETAVTIQDRIKMFNRPNNQNDTGQHRPLRNSQREKSLAGLFEKPHQLIKTDTSANKLYYVEETLTLLRGLDSQVNVVSITGQYKSGKSYLLNKLAGQANGFGVGNTTNACTKGIWIRCLEHPSQTDQVLMLLDVEGFGDAYKANEDEDLLLFTLATLLCSTLVYNNIGAFDKEAIKRLRFLGNIDMCVVDAANDLELLDFYLPRFVLTLRDFDLHLKTQAGVKTTPDGYFEELLSQNKEQNKWSRSYNDTRLLIRTFFKARTCFLFKRPHMETTDMETKRDEELNPEFLKNVKRFRDYVYSCRPMAMKSDQPIKGRMFASLVKSYVDQISAAKSPCIRDAIVEMRQIENELVLEEACNIYSEEMKRRLALINPKEPGFVNHHKISMERALEYLKTAVVFDDEQICRKQMQARFKELYSTFKMTCDKNSRTHCLELLTRLHLPIQQKLDDNVYAKEGGYNEYSEDLKNLIKIYDGTCGLGTQSQNVLQTFLDDKKSEEEIVNQLEKEATGKVEEISGRAEERNTPIQRSDSYVAEMSGEMEELDSRISQEIGEKQETSYQTIKQKYIKEKLSSAVDELDRRIHEGEDGEIDALQNEKSFLVELINGSQEGKANAELIEKLHATPIADKPAPSEIDQVPGNMKGTIFNIPWEYNPQPIGLESLGPGEVPKFEGRGEEEKSFRGLTSSRRKRKRFCFIQ